MSEVAPYPNELATGIRTLIAAGYSILSSATLPRHEEVMISHKTVLGAEVSILVAFTSEDELSDEEIKAIKVEAARFGSHHLVVSNVSSDESVSWGDFFRVLGGEVPSWRALSADFQEHLITTAQNKLPEGLSGEPWFLFEQLAKDGFEFAFGKRVIHLGGIKRGARVADLLAQMPDGRLLVIDAKATGQEFDARVPELRALGEYVRRQIDRQQGQVGVFSAVVVSSSFQQDEDALLKNGVEFRTEFSVPVAFVTATVLSHIVECTSRDSTLRIAIRWPHLFQGGLVTEAKVDAEIQSAVEERLVER